MLDVFTPEEKYSYTPQREIEKAMGKLTDGKKQNLKRTLVQFKEFIWSSVQII